MKKSYTFELAELQEAISQGKWKRACEITSVLLAAFGELSVEQANAEMEKADAITVPELGDPIEVHASDTIKIKGITPEGRKLVEKYGPYWMVLKGSTRRGYREWFCKQVRPVKAKAGYIAYEDWFAAQGHDIAIIACCPVHTTFRREDYDHVV